MSSNWRGWLQNIYVFFAFCSALFFGALKGLVVGPVAGLILIVGNVGVILGLFPAHVVWTIYTVIKTPRLDTLFKLTIMLALPALFALWLGLSLAGSVMFGVGYGFFTPWVSAFEAFRNGNEFMKFLHCIVDGTWDTIKGSCTIVRDFGDVCYHSYPLYLKEIREAPTSNELQTLRFIHVPGIIIVGVLGLIVEVPSYTVIALIKSPLMLFKGWQRLVHDLISREGPFLETACIPVAGLTILLWPLAVFASVFLAIFCSIFVGLYGCRVVYQERSFLRGVAYVIAMVAEFDEYTNDLLYLREGSILPKPRYRKQKENSTRGNSLREDKLKPLPLGSPSRFMPELSPARSVRETIQELKMVQIWGNLMRGCELRGKELMDTNVIQPSDLYEWLKAKNGQEATIIGVGLPSYSCLHTLLGSIEAGVNGILLLEDLVMTQENRPSDRLLDWFFQPLMVLKDQIQVIKLTAGEIRYLEKAVLFGSDGQRMENWENGGSAPGDPLRAAQIQGISRRLTGMMRSISKFPTYRRRYRHIVKELLTYYQGKVGTSSSKFENSRSPNSMEEIWLYTKQGSTRSNSSVDIV